ncbi:MAG: transposase [[Clostridium] scindens]
MYAIPFRIVRFPVSENAYEVVVSKSGQERFPSELLKQLYAKRWGIETSFRDLKYTIGLLHFHSKKVEHILQEIYARLIMYNFSELSYLACNHRKENRKL